MKWSPIMCLTTDGMALTHVEQVAALCRAGATLIQLRMKRASDTEIRSVINQCLPICRRAGSRLIINDHFDAALKGGADGVHLGRHDLSWEDARECAGDDFIIGGTVNTEEDACRADAAAVLNYVGVGPYRFTRTKEKLAAVLEKDDWQRIQSHLGDMPVYAIGGICLEDLSTIQSIGVSGVAVCASLISDKESTLIENYRNFATAWMRTSGAIMTEQ